MNGSTPNKLWVLILFQCRICEIHLTIIALDD